MVESSNIETIPEFRKNNLSDIWVIISPLRKKRPVEDDGEGNCPFCAGNEYMTPPEIYSIYARESEKSERNWLVRVVPNKYPALSNSAMNSFCQNELYLSLVGFGSHEVVIETPDHNSTWLTISDAQLVLVLQAYVNRLRSLRKKKYLKYALIFKNSGRRAGASLNHPHSQIIATPILSTKAITEYKNFQKFYRAKKTCLLCEMQKEELRNHERVVQKTENFLAFVPFAARFPYETWILPRQHFSRFEDMEQEHYEEFAKILKAVLNSHEKIHGLENFNFLIHTAPFYKHAEKYYHWRAELLPLTSNVAGFERGAGFYINENFPEISASEIRSHYCSDL